MSGHLAEFHEAANAVKRAAVQAEDALADSIGELMPAFPVIGRTFVENAQLVAEVNGRSTNLLMAADRIVEQLMIATETCRAAATGLSEVTTRLAADMAASAGDPPRKRRRYGGSEGRGSGSRDTLPAEASA